MADIVGVRSGMVTVIGYSESRYRWLARCDCGRAFVTVPTYFHGPSAYTYHCGCLGATGDISYPKVAVRPEPKAPKPKPVKVIESQPVVVPEPIPDPTESEIQYRTNVPGPAMCYKRRKVAARRVVQSHDDLVRWLYDLYRSSAEKRKKVFALSLAEFTVLIQQPCHYCGTEPRSVKEWHEFRLVYNGIDRQDNARGYEMDNCVPCCKLCNMAKHQLSVAEFTAHVRRIVAHLDTL